MVQTILVRMLPREWGFAESMRAGKEKSSQRDERM